MCVTSPASVNMWSTQLRFYWLLFTIVMLERAVIGNPVSSTFNTNLREYSVKEDGNNSTARTLQQEELGRYANFAPVNIPIRFKDVPDNALSSSSYSRGLAHLEHEGYGLHDYDENHYGYGFDYNHGGFDHHIGHHGHHLGHGHHHKHYDHHALAAKSIFWPLAGLAILGTAAALVSNPILLQLGVISGRRRRDTKEVATHLNLEKWKKEVAAVDDDSKERRVKEFGYLSKRHVKKGAHSKQGMFKKAYPIVQSTIESVTLDAPEHNGHIDDDRFVPVPLRIKEY